MEKCKPQKIRNVPHIEGNFNAYYYIKVKQSKPIKDVLEMIIQNINLLINNSDSPFLYENIIKSDADSFHISLTDTVFLKYHEIDNHIKKIKKSLSQVKPFSILLTSKIKYYNNQYNTRHFVSLEILKTKQISKLLTIFSDNDLSPHTSILWSDKSFTNCIIEEDLNIIINKKFPKNTILQTIEVDEIHYVIGSRHNKIKLNPYLSNDAPFHDRHHDYRDYHVPLHHLHYDYHAHDYDHHVHIFHQANIIRIHVHDDVP
jgi:hypothetical protein